ncbi:MAG: Hsp20/alpha crystallin family protein [Cyanobacteria bacterium J06635_10]
MAMIRYNPWAYKRLQNQLNRVFEDIQAPAFRTPAAELTETEDALNLRLELPGIEAKDVEIEVTADTVKVIAERKTEHKDDTRTEFYYGKYQRVVPLKARVKNTEVKAEYKDGILNLTLPKSEEEKNKVVKVNLSES